MNYLLIVSFVVANLATTGYISTTETVFKSYVTEATCEAMGRSHFKMVKDLYPGGEGEADLYSHEIKCILRDG